LQLLELVEQFRQGQGLVPHKVPAQPCPGPVITGLGVRDRPGGDFLPVLDRHHLRHRGEVVALDCALGPPRPPGTARLKKPRARLVCHESFNPPGNRPTPILRSDPPTNDPRDTPPSFVPPRACQRPSRASPVTPRGSPRGQPRWCCTRGRHPPVGPSRGPRRRTGRHFGLRLAGVMVGMPCRPTRGLLAVRVGPGRVKALLHGPGRPHRRLTAQDVPHAGLRGLHTSIAAHDVLLS
jgi:hypothetical protein